MSPAIVLLPGEQIVTTSDKNILTLTTKRVRFNSSRMSSSNFISITLESVASVGLVTKSFPLLLLLAGVSAIGFFSQQGDVQWAFLAAAIFMVVAFALTRNAIISIASNGGETILVPARGMNRESILEFLDGVEREKLKAYASKE